MKKSLYFQHDYNARNDPKLQDVLIDHGVAGLGLFWCIVEQLYEQDGTLALKSCKSIAYALHAKVAMVESIVKDYGLFGNDGENFWSDSILRRLARSKNIAAQRKAAALVRWKAEHEEQTNCNANAMQEQCKTAVNKDIDKDEKENEKKIVQRFIPPTIAEVQAYIQQKGYSIDAESFVAFYESKGWMVGKNKMKDWHMALVTWSKRNRPAYTTNRSSTTRNCNDEWK